MDNDKILYRRIIERKNLTQHISRENQYVLCEVISFYVDVASTDKHWLVLGITSMCCTLFDRREGNVLFSANANGLC